MLNSTQQLQTERELKVQKKIKTIKIHNHKKNEELELLVLEMTNGL